MGSVEWLDNVPSHCSLSVFSLIFCLMESSASTESSVCVDIAVFMSAAGNDKQNYPRLELEHQPLILTIFSPWKGNMVR